MSGSCLKGIWKASSQGQVGTGQVRTGQVGTVLGRTGHIGTGQIETGEVGTILVLNKSRCDGSIPEALCQATTDNVRAGQAWSDQFGSDQVRTGQARKVI